MKLKQNEIKQITQAADVLQKWSSYVVKKGSDDLSCHIALLASVETTIDQAIDVLLTKNPKLGQDIKSECEKLLSGAKMIEELRKKNTSEARLNEIELLGPARRLISRFQQIAQNAREELSSETPAETKQNPTKRGRLKPILCAISGLVVFLAAMLTIFHLLGWLEPIRAFISNIVSNN